MLKLFANVVIAFFVLWTLAVSISEFLGITIHFPWIISGADEIPIHRLQSLRIAILLTFAHYGVFHLFGKNREYLPIHFLSQFLFYLVISGGLILYRTGVATSEYGILMIFTIVWLLTIVAGQPLNRDYFRNKWKRELVFYVSCHQPHNSPVQIPEQCLGICVIQTLQPFIDSVWAIKIGNSCFN